MRKRTTPTLVVVVVAAVASMAVGLSVASAKPKASVTLTMLMPTTFQFATDIANKNFSRIYPDIQIQAQYLPSDQLSTLLVTQLQAGNAPDLFFTKPGRSRVNGVWPLGEAGKLLDLTGRKWQGRIYAPAKKLSSVNGKIYSWPGVVLPFDIVYNADLFKQLRLKAPKNFGEVLALCKQVNAAGKIPFVQAWGNVTAGNIVGRQRMSEYVYSVDPNWNDKRAKNQVTFSSSPLWRRALQSIVDMKDANCFQPAPTGTSRPQQYAMIARGDAVMSVMASSEIPSVLNINPTIKLQMLNLPPDNAKQATIAASTTYMISANAATKYAKEARLYIDFVAREQQNTLFAKISYGVAPLDAKKGLLPDWGKELRPLFKPALIKGQDADAEWPNSRVYEEAYAPGIQGLFTGQTTIDSILKKMDDLWVAG
jgi:raffinose/stachyose/melibiose transport system substrate-binding protein